MKTNAPEKIMKKSLRPHWKSYKRKWLKEFGTG